MVVRSDERPRRVFPIRGNARIAPTAWHHLTTWRHPARKTSPRLRRTVGTLASGYFAFPLMVLESGF
jgi:hypothetical protein